MSAPVGKKGYAKPLALRVVCTFTCRLGQTLRAATDNLIRHLAACCAKADDRQYP
jgi:hypothetical protein